MDAVNARINGHDRRVPQRPPRRCGQYADVAGRSKEEPERRRRTLLIGIHTRDRQQAACADRIDRSARLRHVDAGVEHRVPHPEHEDALGRAGQHAQELAFHPHQLGVVVGGQHGSGGNRQGGRLVFDTNDLEDGVAQNRLSGADRREACHFHELSRPHLRGLFGLDAHAAGRILDVQDVQHIPERRRRREVFDLDGPPGNARGDDPADANAAVHLADGGIVVDLPAGPGGERERIGRRLQHDHVADAPRKQRDAPELLGLPEDRADVAAQPHAGVDEPGQVLGRIVPERSPGPRRPRSRRRRT